MKLNSTIGLTLILLATMLVAGVVSAMAGMSMGKEALKGITQPDTRPTNSVSNRTEGGDRKDELVILPEDKIIATVKARTGSKITADEKPEASASKKTEAAESKFPVTDESKGVTFEVKSVEQQGDAFVFSVSLKNESDNPIKFLYSFLEIKDDQGRGLSANTEGLPSELPPDKQPYAGTIRIPATSIEKVQKVSLLLSDYPNQQVQLELSDVPLSR
jgi:hypothetical protein